MREYYPLLIMGAILGVLSICFVLAYAMMKNKKETDGFKPSVFIIKGG